MLPMSPLDPADVDHNAFGMSRPGRFVVVEGIDRAGKTTFVAALVAHALRERMFSGVLVLAFPRRPYGATPAQRSREWHAWCREDRERARRTIEDARASGMLVVADRYTWSGEAYERAAWDPDPDFGARYAVHEAHRRLTAVPDCTVFLAMDPGQAAKDPAYGTGDAGVLETLEYQRRVHAEFARILVRESAIVFRRDPRRNWATTLAEYPQILVSGGDGTAPA